MAEAPQGRQERELADAFRDVDDLMAEGQYTRAQAVCRKLLAQNPTSAAVHEKMGDVLHRRALWQDAAEWYQLSAQLSETPEVRAKIADATRRAREARLGGPEPEEIAARTAQRQRVVLRLLGMAAFVTMTVAVVVAVRLLTLRRAEAPPVSPEAQAAAPVTRSTSLSGPPTKRPARPSPSAPRGAGGAEENPERHWAAVEAPPRPLRRQAPTTVIEDIAGPVTEADRAVISAVSSLTWGEGTDLRGRVAAQVDPYSGFAMITVTIPRSVPAGTLLERVVRQAHRVCLTAIRTDESIKSITIRVLRSVSGSRSPVLAFRGNTSREVLEQYRDSNVKFEILWEKVFRTVRWNPEISGGAPVETEEAPSEGV
jgi:hypothetical protein